MTRREIVGALVALVVVGVAGSLIGGRVRDHEQTAAHGKTVTDETHLAKVDTVRIEAEASAAASRVIFRRATDTVLTRLTDTVRVKEYIAQAVQTVTRDSIALVADSSGIAARDTIIADVKRERDLALHRTAPRLDASATALYDPLGRTPAASVDASFRLVRSISLTVRAEQRFAPGESLRAYVGVRISL